MNQKQWHPVTATITSVESKSGLSQTLETDDNPERTYFLIHIRYAVDGHSYAGSYESRSSFEPGHIIEILYNPANPAQNSASKAVPTRISRIILWTIVVIFVSLLLFLAIAVK